MIDLSRIALSCMLILAGPHGLAAQSSQPPASAPAGLNVRLADGSHIQLYREMHALVIGNDKYSGSLAGGYDRLNKAVDDAKRVAEELSSRGFKVVLRNDLTFAELEKALSDFFYDPALQDPMAGALIWFSGHGDTLNGEGYIVATDTPRPFPRGGGSTLVAEAAFRHKAISMRRFDMYLRETAARHVLVVLDSCFAGTVFSVPRSSGPSDLRAEIEAQSRQFITSGSATNQVDDDGKFADLFLRAIRGEDPDADFGKDSYVTGYELGSYLMSAVPRYIDATRQPQFGPLRDVRFDKGDFVFAVTKPSTRSVQDRPRQQALEALSTRIAVLDYDRMVRVREFVEDLIKEQTEASRILIERIARLSDRALAMIIQFETGGRQYYETVYKSRPYWPGAQSGVTLGVDYDLGYVTHEAFRQSWGKHLPKEALDQLSAAVGLRGEAAREALRTLKLQDIEISWDKALEVFNTASAPRYIEATRNLFPSTERLHPDSFGALVSLVQNRGVALDGDRRREMRDIKTAMEQRRFDDVPGLIRSMKRLAPQMPGISKRRDAEAALFESGLAAMRSLQPR